MKFASLCPPGLFGFAMCALAAPAGAQTYFGPGGVIPSGAPGVTGGGTYSAIAPCSTTSVNIFSSSLIVPVSVCTVDQIQINNWTHTWVGDQQIVLIDPAGKGHNIMVRPGFNSAGAAGNSGNNTSGIYKFVVGGTVPPGILVPDAAATNMPAAIYIEHAGDPGGVVPGGLWGPVNTITNTTTGVVTTVVNGMASVPCAPWPAGSTWELLIYDWAAGDVGAITGWGISVNGSKPPPPVTFCSSLVSCSGCRPIIGSNWPLGVPSATAGFGFNVTCGSVVNNKPGLLMYSVTGPAAIPFFCGTLCLLAPVKRTPGQGSGGNPSPVIDCSGTWNIDMNLFAVGGLGGFPHPLLTVPGSPVWCQWWGRDPACAACNAQLSDALNYIVGP